MPKSPYSCGGYAGKAMQVTPIPPPVMPAALPQDAAKVVPQVQTQAAVPITQRAVDPAPRSDRGQQTRSNGDRAKGGQSDGDKRGGSVNIRV